MPKIGKTDILPDLRVAADLDAERLNHRDFRPDQFARQAIAWNAGVEHAGGLRFISKIVGRNPMRARSCPAASPAGPEPMIAIRSPVGFGKLGIREELKQVTEFFDIVTLARFRSCSSIGKQFTACITARITSECLTNETLEGTDRNRLIDGSPAASRLAGAPQIRPHREAKGFGPRAIR